MSIHDQLAELPNRTETAELRVPVSVAELRSRLGSGVTRLSVDLTTATVVAPRIAREQAPADSARAEPTVSELRAQAKELKVPRYSRMGRVELEAAIAEAQASA